MRCWTGGFNLGRNTIAVIEPAVGGFMLFGGCGLLTDATGGEDSFLSELFFYWMLGVIGGGGVGFGSGAVAGGGCIRSGMRSGVGAVESRLSGKRSTAPTTRATGENDG